MTGATTENKEILTQQKEENNGTGRQFQKCGKWKFDGQPENDKKLDYRGLQNGLKQGLTSENAEEWEKPTKQNGQNHRTCQQFPEDEKWKSDGRPENVKKLRCRRLQNWNCRFVNVDMEPTEEKIHKDGDDECESFEVEVKGWSMNSNGRQGDTNGGRDARQQEKDEGE